MTLHAPGVIARGAVEDHIALGKLAVVETKDLRFIRHIHAVRLQHEPLDPDAQLFVDLVLELVQGPSATA